MTPTQQREAESRARSAAVLEARQAMRMAEPNPACRIGGGTDRPEDIAFNRQCRKYEKEYQW